LREAPPAILLAIHFCFVDWFFAPRLDNTASSIDHFEWITLN